MCCSYGNSTTNPSWRNEFVVTRDMLTLKVHVGNESSMERLALKKGDIQSLGDSLQKRGLKVTDVPQNPALCGASHCELQIYEGQQSLFSASSYGGGEFGPRLLTDKSVLANCFYGLYNRVKERNAANPLERADTLHYAFGKNKSQEWTAYVVTASSLTKSVTRNDVTTIQEFAVSKTDFKDLLDALIKFDLGHNIHPGQYFRYAGHYTMALEAFDGAECLYAARVSHSGKKNDLTDMFESLYKKSLDAMGGGLFMDATEFCLSYNNGSVAPEYQKSVTYTVSPDSISRVDRSSEGTTTKKFAISKDDFNAFYYSLLKCGIAKKDKPDGRSILAGGHNMILSIFNREESLFAASTASGTLATDENALTRVFENLYGKYVK